MSCISRGLRGIILASCIIRAAAAGADTPPKTAEQIAQETSRTLEAAAREYQTTVTLKPGLLIGDVVLGSGPAAKPGDVLLAHYTGRLTSGTLIDSSRMHFAPNPLKLTVGDDQKLIRGIGEGAVGMRPGGSRNILMAPQFGYGERGVPPEIPPNACLVFQIDALKYVKEKP